MLLAFCNDSSVFFCAWSDAIDGVYQVLRVRVGVNLRTGYLSVSKQFLDDPDIRSLHKSRCECMPENVRPDSPKHRFLTYDL